MSKLVFFLLIVSFILHHHTTEAIECAVPNQSKTRVFDTIVHYQGNKISFSPLKGDWQGSIVEFSFSTLDKLYKNIFVSFESQFIITLKLSGKQIKQVDDGAFISLQCLHELFLDHNNITEVSKNTFQGLDKVKKLDLSNNKLKVVRDMTFVNLPRLTVLNLSNNQIKSLDELAFINLTSLEYLNLESNRITKLLFDVFSPLVNLATLILAWNKLGGIEPEKWNGLGKLRNLDLAGNGLNHFDPSYNFTFAALKSLNVSFNSLTQLNVFEIRKHLPGLELIDLNYNPWFCDDLDTIIRELKDSKIKFASRNFSRIQNNQGVPCSPVPAYSTSTTEVATSTSSSSTTNKSQIWVDKDELERYVEKKIADNNVGLRSSIESLRSFIIFIFALVCIFLIIDVFVRTQCCRIIRERFRARTELYFDNSDVENFRLLHR